jgi:hypothetical protein
MELYQINPWAKESQSHEVRIGNTIRSSCHHGSVVKSLFFAGSALFIGRRDPDKVKY